MAEIIDAVHLDDDPLELQLVQLALRETHEEWPVRLSSVASIDALETRLGAGPMPELILLDAMVGEPDREGEPLVRALRCRWPNIVIIMYSQFDGAGPVAGCLAAGADNFISKGLPPAVLARLLQNTHRSARLKRLGPCGPRAQTTRRSVGATMDAIARRIPHIVDSAVSAVYVEGETGTGKEVVADAFNAFLGPETPFVRVNCGAIPASLMESELFGHVKGAFTGAGDARKGLLETASSGWIFLDELGSMSVPAQVALLRVLENQEVVPVGSSKPRKVNVRVLAASNEPLPELVARGRFRNDLWQRLCEVQIRLPPLRTRAGEIEALIGHFLGILPRGPYTITPAAMNVLISRTWRDGNIRQLRNCLRAMTEHHIDKLLTPASIPVEHLDHEILGDIPPLQARPVVPLLPARPAAPDSQGWIQVPFDRGTSQPFEVLADRLLIEVLQRHADVLERPTLRELARRIGISRSTLSWRLRRLRGDPRHADLLSQIPGLP